MRVLKKRKLIDMAQEEVEKAALEKMMQDYAAGRNSFRRICTESLDGVRDFWDGQPQTHRKLIHLALVLLSAPPHAAGVERCFSAMGRTHSDDRNRLSMGKAGMITTIQMFNRQTQPEGPPHIAEMVAAKKAEWMRARGRPPGTEAKDGQPARPELAVQAQQQQEQQQQAGFNAAMVQIAHRQQQVQAQPQQQLAALLHPSAAPLAGLLYRQLAPAYASMGAVTEPPGEVCSVPASALDAALLSHDALAAAVVEEATMAEEGALESTHKVDSAPVEPQEVDWEPAELQESLEQLHAALEEERAPFVQQAIAGGVAQTQGQPNVAAMTAMLRYNFPWFDWSKDPMKPDQGQKSKSYKVGDV